MNMQISNHGAVSTSVLVAIGILALTWRQLAFALLQGPAAQFFTYLVQPAWVPYVAAGAIALVVIVVQRRESPASRLSLSFQVVSAGQACLLLTDVLQLIRAPAFEVQQFPSDLGKQGPAGCKKGEQWPETGGHQHAAAQGAPGTSLHAARCSKQKAACLASHQLDLACPVVDPQKGWSSAVSRAAPPQHEQQDSCPAPFCSTGGIVRASKARMKRSVSCPPQAAGRLSRPDLARACSTPACLQSHSLHLDSSEAGSYTSSFADLTSLDAPACCSCSDDEYCSGSETPSSDDGGYQDANGLQDGTAIGSLGLDGAAPAIVCQACTEAHLLQFAWLLGDRPPPEDFPILDAWGQEDSLFGMPDTKSADAPWELIVQECSDDLSYRAWRKPLRGGLFLYKTHAVVERAAPADVRAFHMDDLARHEWDDNVMEVEHIGHPSCNGGESCVVAYRARWPRPLTSREYVYARRVWDRPADGGCWAVAASVDAPAPAHMGRARVIRVHDFASAFVIRGALSCRGLSGGTTEIAAVYFEDPCVRPGIMNLAVRKGLWAYMQKYVAALHAHTAAAAPSNNTSRQAHVGAAAAYCGDVRGITHQRLSRAPLLRVRRVRKAAGRFTRHRLLLTATILAILC